MRRETIPEIMSTTRLGETVVLKETEINTYVRKRNGLQLISSKKIYAKRLNSPQDRSLLQNFRRFLDRSLHHQK